MSSLIFSQSSYPLQTIIKGDSVVILTKKQATDINTIFESQRAKISTYKAELTLKDSLLAVKQQVIDNYKFDYELAKRLDLLENWTINAAINSTWIYYSWQDSLVYAVDLSQYFVRKDDSTGNLYFLHTVEPISPKENKEQPPLDWQKEIIEPKRPVVTTVPIKL